MSYALSSLYFMSIDRFLALGVSYDGRAGDAITAVMVRAADDLISNTSIGIGSKRK